MFRRGVFLMVVPMLCIGVLARPAAAQAPGPGYPGPTTTVPGEPTSEEQNGGTVRAGGTAVIESCGFAGDDGPIVGPLDEPDAAVEWNGQPAGTGEAGEDGCVAVAVEVNDREEVPPCPAVTVNGQERDGRRGRNDLVVTGEGENGAPRTVSTRLSISCGGGGPDGSSASAEATGDPGVRIDLDSDSRSLISASGRSTTRWALVGMVFLAVVAALVGQERRRRSRRARFTT